MSPWICPAVATAGFAAGFATESLRVARALLARRAGVEGALAGGATVEEAVDRFAPRFNVGGWLATLFVFACWAIGASEPSPKESPPGFLTVLLSASLASVVRAAASAFVGRRLFSDGLPPEEPEAGAARAFRIVSPVKTYDESVKPKVFDDRDLKD